MDAAIEDELTVRQAARRVGRAEETVRRWIWSGRLPARKLGNVYYVRVADVDALSTGGSIPRPRAEPTRLTMSEWLEKVARWKATSQGLKSQGPRRSAADLVREEREHQEERGRRMVERDWS
jgi:excisionase family DNA binding protein